MDSVRAKVLVIGPKRCGKTRIADFLAGHSAAAAPSFEVYNPTKGARILEFEQVAASGRKNMKMSVQLWDCSGDRQYENCWPAILRDAVGVVLVYDPTIKEQEKDIELWYKTYTRTRRCSSSPTRAAPPAFASTRHRAPSTTSPSSTRRSIRKSRRRR